VSGVWPGLPDPQCLASFFSFKKKSFFDWYISFMGIFYNNIWIYVLFFKMHLWRLNILLEK
jgi:hypothetical protein